MLELEKVINNSKKKLGSLREKLIGDNNQGRDNSNIINDLEEIISELTASLDSKIDDQEFKKSDKIYKSINKELELILNNIPALIFYKDLNNNYIRVNKACVEANKKSKAELEGKSLFDIYPNDIAQAYYNDDLEVVKTKKPKLNIEEFLETQEGRDIYLTNKIPIINDSGIVTGILGFAINITKRKMIEEELRNSQSKLKNLNQELETRVLERTKELKESEEKFRTITEHSSIGTVIIQDNKIKYVNKAMLEINEFTMTEMMEWSPRELLNSIHPEDRKQAAEYLKGRQTGVSTLPPYSSYRIITKNGKIKWIDSYSKTITYLGQLADLALITDVTEQNLSKLELKESEAKYRILFENMNAGFAYHEVLVNEDNKPIDYRYIEANNQFEKMTGLKVSDIIGKTVTEILPGTEDDPADWIGKFGNVGLTGVPLTVEDYSEAIDRWFKVSGYSPKKGFFAVTFNDITDRKRAEKKLKESERKYRGLVNNISDIIYEIDIKGKCSYVSHQLFDISGFFPEEMIGQNVFKFVHPDDLFKVAEEVKMTFNSEDNRYIEFRLRHKDGHYVSVSSRLSTITIGEKKKLTGLLVDIAERKKVEQQLRESEEFFRTITEQSLLGIIIIQDGILKYVNDITLNYSGYSRDEVINLPETQLLKFIHPEDGDIFKQALIDPTPKMTFRLLTKAGDTKWIDINTKTIYYKAKEAYLLAFLDVTEIKEAEQIVKDEIIKLKELDELKSDFVYRASHELKTPLNSIVSASTLLIDSYRDSLDERVYSLINVINKGGKRLDELIGDLLDVSRIESGKLLINKKKEDIVEIIKSCTQDMIFLINKRNLKIDFKYLQERFFIDIDKKRFEQVILNILSNSIKNTPSKGTISIDIKSEKKFIDISITDTGVGFTKKEKEKLFQKFGKIERHGKGMDIITEGTGLGLYLSKEIIELHGGEIWVESQGRNKGSTIVIRLPYKK